MSTRPNVRSGSSAAINLDDDEGLRPQIDLIPVLALLSDLGSAFTMPPAPYLTEDYFNQRVEEFKKEVGL